MQDLRSRPAHIPAVLDLGYHSRTRRSPRGAWVHATLAYTAMEGVHGCQRAIARFLDCMCLALLASGLWLRSATLQNWIAPGLEGVGAQSNPRKGRD